MKTFVLDTNVLLHDAYSIYKLGANEIIIPAVVLEEVDSKKRLQDEVGRNARMVSRILKELRKEYPGKLSKGIPLHTGGTLRVELNHKSFEALSDIFMEVTNDNRILAVTKNLQDEDPSKDIVLISNDGLMVTKADAIGLHAEEYENDRLVDDAESIHKGYHEVIVPNDLINKFYRQNYLNFEEISEYFKKEAYVQDFFILKDGGQQSAVTRLQEQNGQLRLIEFVHYDGKSSIWDIKHKNIQQKMLLELLLDDKVELVCVTGQAGTGKTLLALAAGLYQTEDLGRYSKVLAARPIVGLGKQDIGFLPGEKDEKLRPWMQPIYDNLEFLFNIDGQEEVKKDGGKKKQSIDDIVAAMTTLQVEALNYIRGRSIPKQFFLIDECQNLTPLEIKTIISRAARGTKIILMGDPAQIDHPYLDATNNGLVYAIERMKQEPEVGIINLEKTERSTLADKAARLL